MVTSTHKKQILIISVGIIFFILLLIFSFNTLSHYRLFSDSSFYRVISANIASSGGVSGIVNQIAVKENIFMPVVYPQNFFVLQSIFIILISNSNAILFVNTLLFLLIGLFLILSIKEFFNKTCLALLGFLLLFLSKDFLILTTSRFKIDLLIVFFILISMFCLLKFWKFKDFRWLVLSSIFISASVIMKQTALIVLFLFVLLIIFFVFNRIVSKRKFIIIVVILSVLVLPSYLYLFSTTGTFFYHSFDLGPINEIESFFTNLFKINTYSVNPAWKETYAKSLVVQNRDSIRNNDLLKILIFPIFNSKSFIPFLLVFLLFTFVLYSSIREKNPILLYLLLLVVSTLLIFYFSIKIWSYFTYLELISLFFIMGILNKNKSKRIKFLIILFIVVISILSLTSNLSQIKKNNLSSLEMVKSFKDLNSSGILEEGEVVVSPRIYELALYTNTAPVWVSPYSHPKFFEAISILDTDLLIKGMNEVNSSKIIIPPKRYRSKDYNTWVFSFPTEMYDKIKDDKNFEKIYSKKGIEVYKITKNEN